MCLDGPTKLPVASSQQLLEEAAQAELGSNDVSINLTAGSNKGDNYLGVVFRAEAECRGTGKRVSIIAKLPPTSEARRKQFIARASFEREILFYTEIYPMMVEFQREKGLDTSDGRQAFNQIPRCLRTCLVDCEEAILMEDLKASGFDMYDRHKALKVEHYRLAVSALARMHAISFALKDQHPERIDPYKGMVDLFLAKEPDEAMGQWFTVMIDRALGTLDIETESEVYARTKKALDADFLDIVKSLTDGKAAEPYAVLCHGDCWNNNMLFKHEKGSPVDFRLLDWQICRYASPALDLMYLIFTSSNKAFRDQHYQSLIDLYHRSLSDFLRRLGSDPERLFPREALDQQLKQFGRFGLLMAVLILPMITTKSEDVPDLEEMAEKMENGFNIADEMNNFRSEDTEAIYRQKMSDCCRDMVQFGYI
ncbi:uncharacterized protein LOC131425603 [Malaya genurostris]|uniref:uncharacterized protein LOC131425603 n=1 Tax=Malaya genurostris TaxID=325434 RepID=UPI0026F3AD6A|nr:uncharacterized protein LOC131425603 [Malaya genurostris]XP_058443607.1 uncharacterized protein LOC131425603 [Malaya genurostris]